MADMCKDEMINDLPKTLISWYDFGTEARILFVSGGKPESEILFEVCREKAADAVRSTVDGLHAISGKFDYIVAVGIVEKSTGPEALLAKLKKMLKDTGKLLVGCGNRLAIRYFCGDKDEFSGNVLDGIDNYLALSAQRKKKMGGRAYSRAELKRMFVRAGFKKCKFYSVMPELMRPQILISEDYVPNESVDVRVFPQYKSPDTIFLEEERLYAALMENGMFHPMANGFLVECSADGELSDADQITVQGDRGRREGLATVIKKQGYVIKKALYLEGRPKINVLMENTDYLKQHGVPMADARVKDGIYVMPYVTGQIATEYFRELLRKDKRAFLCELEKFRQIIADSSEHVPYVDVNWRQFEPCWEKRKKDDPNIDQWEKRAFGSGEEKQNIGIILKRGFIDMVSLNCFHTEKGFVFFDQEFSIEHLPLHSVLIRTIDLIYRDSPDLEEIYHRDNLLEYFHLFRYQDTWRMMGNVFLEKLRNDRELSGYHRLCRRENRTVLANRHRMNYSQEEYGKLFTNIFKGIGSRKIYLFGSGQYAEQFINQFGQFYNIAGIVDNKESRWGESLLGIGIYSPEVLKELDMPFKVFICIKFFEDVLLQLRTMGIKDFSVYDPRLDYERPLTYVRERKEEEPKKYHIGYIAGVFDLFHIGHLNLFMRAKKQCDYLIVGVVSDEQVIKSKKTKPYIPFGERLAIVQACRYVDEAVGIPADRPNTEDAYYRYHFDVQFSGSDYEEDPEWLSRKVFLHQHGADMVFLPYTQTTSSTEIKEQIKATPEAEEAT